MKVSDRKKLNTYLILNIVWGALSLILLLLVLYFTWQKERITTEQSIYSLTENIADQLDNFLQEIVDSILNVNINPNGVSGCSPDALRQLQQVIYNQPFISGIAIESGGNTVCSTFHQETLFKTHSPNSIYLFGPIHNTLTDKPAYVLQQRVGDIQVEIYLLDQILARNLQSNSSLAESIALYSVNDEKIILQISRLENSRAWHIDKPQIYLKEQEENDNIMRANLIFLDDFQVIVKADLSQIRQITWRQELAAAITIILFSIAMYYLLRYLITRHFSLRRAITLAMKNERFFPMYQPILDTKLDKCIGAEILLRWRTADQEVITPDFFIRDVEESGMIVNITLQLAEKAFAECHTLLLNNPEFHLAFNISSTHFTPNKFFKDFIALCEKFDIPQNQIMLELTERDLLRQDDLAIVKTMKELRTAGFSLAVDDFGTGHASISYLQHFPFNYLKIDQLFVRAIGTGAITETLNKSIIHMAKNLKLHIIAEGVETFAQLEFLQSQGVHMMQGWYFAPAMPLDQLVQFVKGVHYE